MKQLYYVVVLLSFLIVTLLFAGDSDYGNYRGSFSTDDGNYDIMSAQVIAGANDSCVVVITNGNFPDFVPMVRLYGVKTSDGISYKGSFELGPDMGGTFDIKGRIIDSVMEGTFSGSEITGKFNLERVFIKSSTLGSQPPEDAVVLFDGAGLEAWELKNEKKAPWKVTVDSAMQVTRGDIISKQKFGDQQVHVEFKTPLMPDETGQARGNSGVYLQGKYEVQILDSYGHAPADDNCGAIYKVAAPLRNACLPPGEWQTFDITFYGPRFDQNGNKVKDAAIKVKLNGILIHNNVSIPGLTQASMINDEKVPGGLMLQDHGNPVQFRNIWILPL